MASALRARASRQAAVANLDRILRSLPMTSPLDPALAITRRHFFRDCGIGVGKIALASLLTNAFATRASAASVNPMAPKAPHFKARAKRVIYLFMAGAPSHLDLFDHKPSLARYAGKPIPPSIIG